MKSDVSEIEFTRVIKAPQGFFPFDAKELWEYRELFVFLVWRDIKVKYKQTALGALWAVLVPFFQMIVFTLIFGKLAKLPTDGLNPAIFYFAGLLPWTYFAASLQASSNSLVTSAQFLRKIYFPRLVIPIAPCIATLMDFAIALVIMGGMILYFGISLDAYALLAPLLILIAFGSAAGLGMFFSAVNVKYRDIRYIVPFMIQILQYASVIFPFSQLPESLGNWRYLYGLNPMSSVIEGFRWCLLHNNMSTGKMIEGQTVQQTVEAPVELILIGIAVSITLFIVGLIYFKRKEVHFGDIV